MRKLKKLKPVISIVSILLVVIAIECLQIPHPFSASSVAYSQPSTKRGSVRPLPDLRKMADQGDAEAQWRLGMLYLNGDGVRQNDREAAKWFQRAADQSYVPALTALGLQYWAGRGVQQDYNKAYFWYDLALAKGDQNAQSQLDELAAELTPAELATAHEQAKARLQELASANARP